MGAADNNVKPLSCKVCEVFVEIKVVAGQKAEFQPVRLNYIRLGKLKGIFAVQPPF